MTPYNYIPGQFKTPHEWLSIAEQEKKRCVRALGAHDNKGKPRVLNDKSKGELKRWLVFENALSIISQH